MPSKPCLLQVCPLFRVRSRLRARARSRPYNTKFRPLDSAMSLNNLGKNAKNYSALICSLMNSPTCPPIHLSVDGQISPSTVQRNFLDQFSDSLQRIETHPQPPSPDSWMSFASDFDSDTSVIRLSSIGATDLHYSIQPFPNF
jgi:hypothetical protein